MTNQTRTWSEASQIFLDQDASNLKTPLNTILHLSDELHSDESLTQNQREKTNQIRFSANRLLEIFDDFLLLGRLETGTWKANVEPIDLRDLLEKEQSSKPIQISFHIASNLSLVQADKFALQYTIAQCLNLDLQMKQVDIVVERDGNWIKLQFVCYPCQINQTDIDEMNNFQTHKVVHFGMRFIVTSLLIQVMNGQFTLENIDGSKAQITIMLPYIDNG